jgi:beta-lactamase class A
MSDEVFFTLDNSIDLRKFAGKQVVGLLTRVKGKGKEFSAKQIIRYCKLIKNSKQVQWVLNDLETDEVISQSANADERFFGASVSKLFVAAALLHKQRGILNSIQLNHMVKMIVVSSNRAWKELQRQAGDDGTNDSGREAVDAFVQHMGYTKTKGFQGWLKKKDGTRIHGNELNALELSQFLYDTYQRNYEGAEVLWKIMHATRTGRRKIDKYTPSYLYIGGKTGTYSGPNESPETIKHQTIRARNHAAILKINHTYYGLSILTNTGSSEDVAILGGGLIREYLGVEKKIACF